MRAIDRKLFRDLGRLKGQVLTISLVVACGVASYVTFRTTWNSLHDSKSLYYERYRMADGFVYLKRAPESVREQLERVPGVALAYTRVSQRVMLPLDTMLEPAVGELISVPDHGEPLLNGIYIRSGRKLEPGRNDEVLVLEPFAIAHGLGPGDQIPVVINGTLRQLRIAGLAMSPEYVFALAAGDLTTDDKRFAVLWASRSMLEPAFEMEGAFNSVALRFQPGASQVEILDRVEQVLEPYGCFSAVGRDKQLSNFILEGEMTQLEAFATLAPMIFLGVAAFLLNVVLSRLIQLQRTQIAVLKAVGYADRQIGLHFLELVSVIVLIGALLGTAGGAYFGRGMTDMYADYFRFPVLSFRVDLQVTLTAISVSLASGVVGALTSVRRVARLPPAEAMRPPEPAIYHSSLFEDLGLSKIFSTSTRMVAREIWRQPIRTILSSVGIACAIAIMVVGRFGMDSWGYLLDEIYELEQRYDLEVSFIEPLPERAVRELAHLPGVLLTEGVRLAPVRFVSGHRWRDSAIFGLSEQYELRRVVSVEGELIIPPDDGVIISRKLAEVLDVSVGEAIVAESLEGQRQKRSLVVTGLADDSFGMQGYMMKGTLHRFLGETPLVSTVLIKHEIGAGAEIQARLKELPRVGRVSRKAYLKERFEQEMGEMMGVFTLILSLFAGIISVGVVYNNARVALSMRSRDLASLRVLGMTRREISGILLGELAVQLLIAIPIGLWLGAWWAEGIMSTVDPETYRFPTRISGATYAFSTLVSLSAGVVSALLVRRKLDHLDLIGVLKTRE